MTRQSNNVNPPLLMPIVVCAIGFFLTVSLILHYMVETTLNTGNFMPNDWARHEVVMVHHDDNDAAQQRLLNEYELHYPPTDIERTQSFVKSIRTYSIQIVKDEIPYDIYHCPFEPPEQYPFAWNVVDVLQNWNPINETIPPYIYQGLCVFDFTIDMDKALHYRELELPFVVTNTPQIWQTAERWNRDNGTYLSQLLGDSNDNKVEHSTNHHFMYWKHKLGQNTPQDWKPPTDMQQLSFSEWLSKATSPTTPKDWYYFRYKAVYGELHSFLYNELPFFQPSPSFFMVEPSHERGINCRFGMTGVLAEAHYDSSRNFVVLLGGSRRYILAHPNQCKHLALYPLDHPSGRHASVDWTNLNEVRQHEIFSKAHVNEVVMQAGDALYLPTHWFHFIQSLDVNYQASKFVLACWRGLAIVLNLTKTTAHFS